MNVTETGVLQKQRWTLVALLSASIAINLLDRQVMNVLAPLLRESMHWTATQYSYIAVGFQVGMMAGQGPIGTFMDRVGTRTGLAAIFIAWSIIGGAHALATSLAAFIVLRFLLGFSECGNYTARPRCANNCAGGLVSPTVDYRPEGTSAIAFVLKGRALVDVPGGSVSCSVL